jgi:hypothetical protein
MGGCLAFLFVWFFLVSKMMNERKKKSVCLLFPFDEQNVTTNTTRGSNKKKNRQRERLALLSRDGVAQTSNASRFERERERQI